MNTQTLKSGLVSAFETAPGHTHGHEEEAPHPADPWSYVIGLALALVLTVASFWAARSHFIYEPGIEAALITLAIAQMGIHLVFFLHITTAPDNRNNVLALGFGVLIVCFVVFGSVWIMTHLNHMTMSMDQLMQMQR
jgi:cytochrome o ubiquinol oxidase operon protein cyoD